MNKLKTLLLFSCISTLWCCSEQPYEKEISNYFQDNAKVVPIIEEIKIDSTAIMESYKDYWTKRANERKESLINNLERDYTYSKGDYERAVDSYKKFPKDYWKERMETAEDKMKSAKTKLDDANNGILNDSRYTKMNRYMDDKSKFNHLVVKYKLSKDGATLIQNFVIQNDSVVYATDRNLDFFISFLYQND